MSETPANPLRRQIPLRVKIARWVFLGILVVLLTAGGSFLLHLKDLREQISAELDDIRKSGYPVTLDELEAWYPAVPNEENAALLYLEAFDKFKRPTDEQNKHLPLIGEADLPSQGQSLSKETNKHIEEYLATNEECIKLLTKAINRTRCRYPMKRERRDGSMPYYDSNHLQYVRACTSLFLHKYILYIDKCEHEQSVDAFRQSVRVACSLDQEPLHLSQLVRVASLSLAFDSLEWALSCRPISDKTGKAIESILDSAYSPQPMLRGFVGERCVYHYFLEQVLILGIREKTQLGFLKNTGPFIKAMEANAPYTNLMNVINTAADDVKRTLGDNVWVSLLEPSYCGSVASGFNLIALHRAAKSALAIERYRQVHNDLPNQLSNLVPTFLPAVPIDPFDEAPLRYKKLPNGYVIYSVGMDGKDDGGGKPVADEQAKDVTFTVER